MRRVFECFSKYRGDTNRAESDPSKGRASEARESGHSMGAIGSVLPAPPGSDPPNYLDEPGLREKFRQNEKFVALECALKTISASKASVVFTTEDEAVRKAITLLETEAGKLNVELVIERVHISPESLKKLQYLTHHTEVPLVYIKGDPIGGVEKLENLVSNGVVGPWLEDHKYDLVVIGGGSGGLAAAKEAARLGKKVACLDFVKPSPQGSTWGLGGTCVNVGCIPKKLMHQASLLGHSISDAKAFGWRLPKGEITHDWSTLRDNVHDYISSLNWGYRVQLREKNVTYINSYGSFTGLFELTAVNKKGKVEVLTADRFLISTGLRPKYPEIPGAKELAVTSDDLFNLSCAPGKTLCVGASYVSLECAGFLHGIGFDVTVMVRSILLRGFDQDMAERIKKHMVEYGVKFESGVPSRIEEIEPKTEEKAGRLTVFWEKTLEDGSIVETSEEYNTVVMAIGREAATSDIGLDKICVKVAKGGKVIGRREQSETTPYVYAIGDVLDGTPELTPVAIQAGRVLMRRLIEGKYELTEYDEIPTTVFTPLEYGCCGLSEEDALKKYGKDEVIVYHNVFYPLEYTVSERMDKNHCYCKLICLKSQNERVIGYHILTPWAGEVTQGFGIALKLKGTKADFDRLIGIHPTVAENFTTLTLIKKEDDAPLEASGC